jgi:hypothetical protein
MSIHICLYIFVATPVFQLEHFSQAQRAMGRRPMARFTPERLVLLLQREDEQSSSQVGVIGEGMGQANRAQPLRPFG